MEREKTKGELIAEKLEKEADEMLKQIQDTQEESEPEAKGLAIEEAEVEDTPEEIEEEVENSPDESQDTEESSDQPEEVQEEETKSEDKGLDLSAEQWEERYKNAQAKMTKSTQREKELESKLAEMDNKIKAMEVMKSDTRIERQKEEVNVDLTEIVKDYPELVKPLQSYVDARIATVEQKVSQATDEVLKAQKEEADKKHFDAIGSAHPDWKAVSESEDFSLWLGRQSNMWQTAASEGDAKDVVELLSRYKENLGLDTKKVSKQDLVEKAKQNVEPSLSKARKQNVSGSKKIWTAKEIGKLSDKEYLKHEKEIDQAHADGRVKP